MRTLLIGVDGAEPDLVEKWDLPHIKSVGKGFEIDTHGNSGPSWASVMTGLKPKDHGVRKLEPQQDIQSWEGVPIWEKIDGYCGIANVPMTYPPDEIRGWMVSGIFTPKKAIYTAPRNLHRDLDDLGYRVDVWVPNHKNHPHGHYGTVPMEFSQEYREDLLDELRTVLKRRGDGFKWLLENEPVDFAFPCFTTLDRVQHLAFHDQDVIKEFYQLMDEQVGKVLDAVSPDTDVFLTSDHGFQRIDRPGKDLEGDHRFTGYGATTTDGEFRDLEELHRMVVESANRDDIEQRLQDLGYI